MKHYFELAKKERVAIKRGDKYIILTWSDDPNRVLITEDWVKKYFEIPREFRVNPLDYSPTCDIYYADKRNLISAGIELKVSDTYSRE